MFDALIFDWDGTLADSRRVVVASFQKALSDLDCEISDVFIEKRIGIGSTETFKEILHSCKTIFDEALIRRLVKLKVRNEIEMSEGITLFNGAFHLLRFLQGRIRLGLASMNDRAVIEQLLRVMSLNKFFSAVVTADNVVYSKPNPEIFLKCAGELNCVPERCVVVEDSVFGVEASKLANMSCIAVLTGAHSKEMLEKANPDLIVNSLTESNEIIKYIFG
jgi:HAD superfamily hydrolase (TIGR01549 family)